MKIQPFLMTSSLALAFSLLISHLRICCLMSSILLSMSTGLLCPETSTVYFMICHKALDQVLKISTTLWPSESNAWHLISCWESRFKFRHSFENQVNHFCTSLRKAMSALCSVDMTSMVSLSHGSNSYTRSSLLWENSVNLKKNYTKQWLVRKEIMTANTPTEVRPEMLC